MANDLGVSREGPDGPSDLMYTVREPRRTDSWPATVRALGPEGISLNAASRPFSPGTLLQAHLIHMISGRRLSRQVRVTNVCLEDGNGWSLQAGFAEPLDPTEIEALLHGGSLSVVGNA